MSESELECRPQLTEVIITTTIAIILLPVINPPPYELTLKTFVTARTRKWVVENSSLLQKRNFHVSSCKITFSVRPKKVRMRKIGNLIRRQDTLVAHLKESTEMFPAFVKKRILTQTKSVNKQSGSRANSF